MLGKWANRWAAALAGAATLFSAAPALAAGEMLLDPYPSLQVSPAMQAPNLFGGLFAGASVGLQVNHFTTFFPASSDHRLLTGVFAGYNYVLSPNLIAGVEVELDAGYAWATPQAFGYNAFALGRIGVLTAPDFMVYQTAGLGVINSTPAFAVGLGIEQSVTDNFSLRFESIAHGQISGVSPGTYYGGFTSLKMAAGALWYLDGDTGRSGWHMGSGTDAPTDFVGPYAGFYVGGIVNPDYSFFPGNPLNGWHLSHFNQGAMAGYNFEVAGPVRAGVEVQGGMHFDTSGDANVEGQLLGRLGLVPLDGLMVYGSAGVGALNGFGAYSLGGGVEYAVWGDATLRLDAQALAMMPPGATAGQFSTAKVTAGTIWHFD